MREIYLDNSATTVTCKEAAEKISELLTEKYGNPSSLHAKGLQAEYEVENARKVLAAHIGASPDEIFFTSGGTESNNLAVIGAAAAHKRTGKRIVVSAIEHSSVLESAKYLEEQGFDVVYLQPDGSGRIREEDIIDAVDEKTILVSLMTVNNEIGTLQPVSSIRRAVKLKKSPALIHTDAVQALGKLDLKQIRSSVDLLTVSAHKIHGPKGTGAIYIKKGIRIIPIIHGGEQQKRIRPGTEASELIAGFGAAISALPDIREGHKQIAELNDYCKQRLKAINGVYINSPEDCLPYILNISVCGIRSETMLHFLEAHGIYVSSGSACAKGKKSHVLSAIGLDNKRIDSAIRISFSRYNCAEDIDCLCAALESGIAALAKSK